MNELIMAPGATMSSKEISAITGKEHSNVLRDIRVMIEDLQKGDSDLNPNDYQLITLTNGMTGEIMLNQDLSLCLGAGYNVILRMKIIKRWKELENTKPTYEMALAVMGVEDNLIPQIAKVYYERDEMKPKVIAFENVIDSQNTYTLDSISDILNIGRTTLSKILEQKKWKTIKETNGTSSTRYAEENGYAKTIYEYIKVGKNDIKTKRIVLKKKGLDKLIKEQTNGK